MKHDLKTLELWAALALTLAFAIIVIKLALL